MVNPNETAAVLKEIVSALDKLEIKYFLTGSLASGVRGEFRATNDIDLVLNINEKDVDSFISLVEKEFFADKNHIVDAIHSSRSFNLIHIETVIKVDCFTKVDDLQIEQMQRATKVEIPGTDSLINVATAEDVILSKLLWYEKGGRVSERQWRDIQGVIAVSKESLDSDYILKWCVKLNIYEIAKTLLASRFTEEA